MSQTLASNPKPQPITSEQATYAFGLALDECAMREAARYWGRLGGKAKSARKAESSRQNLVKARLKRSEGQDGGTGLNSKETAPESLDLPARQQHP